MRPRTLLLLAAAAVALVVVVVATRRGETPSPSLVRVLFNVSEERLCRISIQEGDQQVSAFRRDREWIQDRPAVAATNAALWVERSRALTQLEYDRVLTSADLAPAVAGLEPPESVVVFELTGGRTFKVEFGKDSSASPRSYARLPDDPRIFLVFKMHRDLFRIKLDKDFSGGPP